MEEIVDALARLGEEAVNQSHASMVLAQLEGAQGDEAEKHRDEPEADDDLRLRPSLEFEVVVDGGHAKYPLARELEARHLRDDAERLHQENPVDHGAQDLVLGEHSDSAEGATQRQRPDLWVRWQEQQQRAEKRNDGSGDGSHE